MLIVEAVDITYRAWGWPPKDGFLSAVGIEATRSRRSKRSPPGKCFIEAGWVALPERERDGKAWFRAPSPKDNAARLAQRTTEVVDGEPPI